MNNINKKTTLKIIIPLIISVIVIVGITVVLTAGKSDKGKSVSDSEVLIESTADIESGKAQVITDAVIHDTTASSEEITVQNTTTNKETILKDETSSVEEITPEPETEPVTEPYLEREAETEGHSSEYEPEITTPYPTESPTTKPVEPVTQPPTTEVPTTKEPETTPKPTEPPTTALKENVYVFNDDGTINFKESKINNYDDEFVNYVYQSNEVKNILGEKLYNSISYLELSISSGTNVIAIKTRINNEYWLVMHFDKNWDIHKGSGGSIASIYNPNNLPIKEDW